jgi:hypothetical protein
MDPKQRPGNWIGLASGLALLLAFIFINQYALGAYQASFGIYPDEPAHFMSGVLVRDYLLSGQMQHPGTFAADYYFHRPYMGIGYWPPLFYAMQGVWYVVAGLGRTQAVILAGILTWLLGGSVFVIAVRLGFGFIRSFSAAAVFCLLPLIQWSSCAILTDITVALFCLWALIANARFFETFDLRSALWWALWISCAVMTKSLALFIGMVPVAYIVATGRLGILKKPNLWIAALAVAAACGPWTVFATRFVSAGFEDTREPLLARASHMFRGLGHNSNWILTVLFCLATLIVLVNWKRVSILEQLLVIQPFTVAALILAAPTGIETRYLIPAYAALVLTVLAALRIVEQRFAALADGRWISAACLIGLCGYGLWAWKRVDPLPNQDARRLTAQVVEDSSLRGAAVLVPSNLEGPVIAEFAVREQGDLDRILVRPNKLFARINWTNTRYEPRFKTVEEVHQVLEQSPISVVILPQNTKDQRPHDQLIHNALVSKSGEWSSQSTVNGYGFYVRRGGFSGDRKTMEQCLRKLLPAPIALQPAPKS